MHKILNGWTLLGLLTLILIVHVLATYYYWYWQIWWLDIPMHLAGGFFIVSFVLWFTDRYRRELWLKFGYLEKFLLVLGFVALVGIFWEFYEFFFDVFFKSKGTFYTAQLVAIDTIKDLANDLLGGTAAFLTLLSDKKPTTND